MGPSRRDGPLRTVCPNNKGGGNLLAATSCLSILCASSQIAYAVKSRLMDVSMRTPGPMVVETTTDFT